MVQWWFGAQPSAHSLEPQLTETGFIVFLSSGTAEFGLAHWVILALLVAMVLWLFAIWGRRIVFIQRQESRLDVWARSRGYAFEPYPAVQTANELLPFGSEASAGTTSARLFAGFAGRPPMRPSARASYRWLLTSSANSFDSSAHSRDVRLWESRELTGKPSRPVPTTQLGTVVHTRFSTLVGVTISRDVPPILVAPIASHRSSLGVHRRLRVRTGDTTFDRRFAVLTLEKASVPRVLNERMRSQLLHDGIPAKTSLVYEGRTCYSSGYGLLTPNGLDERIALVHGIRRLLEAQEIPS